MFRASRAVQARPLACALLTLAVWVGAIGTGCSAPRRTQALPQTSADAGSADASSRRDANAPPASIGKPDGATQKPGKLTVGTTPVPDASVDAASVAVADGGSDANTPPPPSACSRLPQRSEPWSGDALITSQAGLSALAGFRKLTGSLTIRMDTDAGDDMTSLAPLACLEEITGDLTIEDTQHLSNLDGLDRLGHLGGSLEVQRNAALAQVDALAALRKVDGSELVLDHNSALTSVAGLSGITYVPGFFDLGFSPLLTDLTGLDHLREVGGPFQLRALGVIDCTHLESLTTVGSNGNRGGNLYLAQDPSLQTLHGLEHLVKVGCGLYIISNPALLTLTALNTLHLVGFSYPEMWNIANNARLPQCQVDALQQRFSASCACGSNSGSGSCP